MTVDDHLFLRVMQHSALFVSEGQPPLPESTVDELGIAVLEERRGRGIGTRLLDELLAISPRVSLSVDDRNPAIGLYERVGFEVVRRDAHSVTMLRSGD
ncbi:MAG: GNAT family N-acetyltransferase [Actinomycetia bacterium]|nr:GNAT family N-acetyltransferase [Actinomycetes bacterium]MCP4962375.1 GNAT family N-acetyltransferase [Actinomycetes bacterium]